MRTRGRPGEARRALNEPRLLDRSGVGCWQPGRRDTWRSRAPVVGPGLAAAHSTQPARPPAQTRRHRGRKLGRPGCEPTPRAPHQQLWTPYVHIQRSESPQHPRDSSSLPSAQIKAGPARPSKLPSPLLPPFGPKSSSGVPRGSGQSSRAGGSR